MPLGCDSTRLQRLMTSFPTASCSAKKKRCNLSTSIQIKSGYYLVSIEFTELRCAANKIHQKHLSASMRFPLVSVVRKFEVAGEL